MLHCENFGVDGMQAASGPPMSSMCCRERQLPSLLLSRSTAALFGWLGLKQPMKPCVPLRIPYSDAHLSIRCAKGIFARGTLEGTDRERKTIYHTARQQNRALGPQVYGRYPNPGKHRKSISTIALAGTAKIWLPRWW